MKIALIGSADFGKAMLEAFLDRGDEVVAVFCAPDNPKSSKIDALKAACLERGLPPIQLPNLKSSEASARMKESGAQICVMAYVLQFVSQELALTPPLGTIQYHPSLLPLYRGPSAINWAIALGERETGLTIFRPSDGLDEGAVILQKTVPIGPDDTTAQVYFDRLFPLGIQALLEGVDLVSKGQHQEIIQDESKANYEGWFNAASAQIHWASHINVIYNLIRAANPAPGAWANFHGEKVQFLDTRKHISTTYGAVVGKPGEITQITQHALWVAAQGGQLEIIKAKGPSGPKLSGHELATALGLRVGDTFDI